MALNINIICVKVACRLIIKLVFFFVANRGSTTLCNMNRNTADNFANHLIEIVSSNNFSQFHSEETSVKLPLLSP